MLLWILLIIIVVLAVGGSPHFGYHAYGWGPSGLLGAILIVLLILVLIGYL